MTILCIVESFNKGQKNLNIIIFDSYMSNIIFHMYYYFNSPTEAFINQFNKNGI